jgi:hypothetical protein
VLADDVVVGVAVIAVPHINVRLSRISITDFDDAR